MRPDHIDRLVQAALAAASQNDFPNHELGPIHLVKYVYLADLAHARGHEGDIYTGAPWRFHHFGPWAKEVFERISPAVSAIHAQERVFASKYRQDNCRWSVEGDELLEQLERELPWDVFRAIRNEVSEFGSDTVSLLHHVYRTPPMLNAAPGEHLRFQVPVETEETSAAVSSDVTGSSDVHPLSKTAAKKLRQRVKEMLGQRRGQRLVEPDPAPRIDDVYREGQEWLDSLAGTPLAPLRGRLRFSDEVWKSDARRERELP